MVMLCTLMSVDVMNCFIKFSWSDVACFLPAALPDPLLAPNVEDGASSKIITRHCMHIRT